MARRLTDGQDLTTLREMNKEMERLKKVMSTHNETTKSHRDALKEIKILSAEIKNIEDERAKIQAKYARKSDNLSYNLIFLFARMFFTIFLR